MTEADLADAESVAFDADIGPVPCQSAGECPQGLGCVEGWCATCEANAHCVPRVCRDRECVDCRSAFECDEGFGCLPDGTCGACGQGKDCSGMLCDEGTCVPCEPGQGDEWCRDQYGDLYRGMYGEESLQGLICRPEGLCSSTCTSGSDCFWVGMVCGDQNYCVACTDDTFCESDATGGYSKGTKCIGGLCIQDPCLSHKSCRPAAPVCDGTCRPCVKKDDCTAVVQEWGTGDSGICTEAQSCEPGDCGGIFNVGCPGGQVCDAYHCRACVAVDEDGLCEDLFKICEPDQVSGGFACKDGKAPNEACFHEGMSVNGVVGQDNRCHLCSELAGTISAADGKCKNAYGPLVICEADACVPGCVPGSRCPDGRLCHADNRCYPCVDVTDDSACGMGYLCIQGTCVPAICRDDDFCINYHGGKVCVENDCVPCGQGAGCPGGFVCGGGQCREGHCCTDANCLPTVECGGPLSCVNYRCEGCVVGGDCYPQWPCLDKSGACVDFKCRDPRDLDVLEGYCFIKNECVTIGSSMLDPKNNQCHVCYWEADPNGALVKGSKNEWTPGTWDPVAKEWETTWCFIDRRCIPAGAVQESVAGYKQAQSAACRHCDPRENDWNSLHGWSIRPDTNGSEDPHVNWTSRIVCDDPLFAVPDPRQPWATVDSRVPAYSGSTAGYCWQGDCRGIAWTPWLPLGPAAAGVAGADVTVAGKALKFVGSFGGGFGAGIPNPNPGCTAGKDCGPCPFLDACR